MLRNAGLTCSGIVGSHEPESPCGVKKKITITQDTIDIIRQEYVDARDDVPGFTLSTPVRARFSNSPLYVPNADIHNPYTINEHISLDDPSSIASAVAAQYASDIRALSIGRYNAQIAATNDPAEKARLQALIAQVEQTAYIPTMTSAWRSPRQNRSADGAPCSNHLKGGAVDMIPSTNLPLNVVSAQNEQWCALRRACVESGYDECNLETSQSALQGAGEVWNHDHVCRPLKTFSTVHSGTKQACI